MAGKSKSKKKYPVKANPYVNKRKVKLNARQKKEEEKRKKQKVHGHPSKAMGFWDGFKFGAQKTLEFANKGIDFAEKVVEYPEKVLDKASSAINEIPAPDFIRKPVQDFIEAEKVAVGVATLGAKEVIGEAHIVTDVVEDISVVMGLGTDDSARARIKAIADIGIQAAREFDLPYEEERRYAMDLFKKGQHAKEKIMGIVDPHLTEIEKFYDQSRHLFTTNPLYEGGQHTYPPWGNDLVGYNRSTLDSSPGGSRSVYVPYLTDDLKDRVGGVTNEDQSGKMSLKDLANLYRQTHMVKTLNLEPLTNTVAQAE